MGLRVGLDLYLDGCTGLTQLPKGLTVAGNLDLTGCTGLTHLPEGLSVGYGLYLNDCTGLTQLPEGLTVAGSLELSGCTGLTQLPEGLTVAGRLDLTGCTSLTELPDRILSWPRGPNGQQHPIFLENTGLSAWVLQRLEIQVQEQGENAGVQLFVSAPPRVEQPAFGTLTEAWQFWTPNSPAPSPNNVWAHLAPDEQAPLTFFLSRLRDTAEYRNPKTRPRLIQRVQNIAPIFSEKTEWTGHALYLLQTASESCGDRLIYGLDELELAWAIRQISNNNNSAESLRALGVQLLKRNIVRAHAQQKVAGLGFVDEVEIYLKYETRLADRLDLPISTRTMLLEACAQAVTKADLEQAAQAAEAAAHSREKVAAFLQTWEPWQRHQRAQTAAQLAPQNLPEEMIDDATRNSEQCPILHLSYAALVSHQEFVQVPVALTNVIPPIPIVDHASLLRWWIEHGTHPVTNTPISVSDILQLKRLVTAP